MQLIQQMVSFTTVIPFRQANSMNPTIYCAYLKHFGSDLDFSRHENNDLYLNLIDWAAQNTLQ